MSEQTDEVLLGLQRIAGRLDDLSRARSDAERAYARTAPARPPRSKPLPVLAGVVVLVLALGVALLATNEDTTTTGSAGGARLLLQAPGWTIIRHDESEERGSTHYETTYRSGDKVLDLHQRPRGYNDEFMQTSSNFTVLGHEGVLFQVGSEIRAFWRDADWDFELRGGPADEAEFRALLASMQLVDEATWDAALPDTVVRPADRERVMAQVLTGVPLPAGYDQAAILESTKQKDRYQFAAQVLRPVLCGWMAQWVSARQTGDVAREKTALDALQSSHSWPEMIRMAEPGDYPEVAWSSVDELDNEATRDAAAQRFLGGFGCGQPPS